MTMLRAISVIVVCAGLLGGCAASLPPVELIEARQAYQRASIVPVAEFTPAELSRAREALAVAEGKATLAEVLATSAAGKAVTTMAKSDSQATLEGMKIREMIAGAKRRAAAILEQNRLQQSKEGGSETQSGGQTLKQPKTGSGQRPPPARESTRVAFTKQRQELDPRTDSPRGLRIARILLVDDGRTRSDSVRRILKSPDYQVVEAADCDNAIDLIGNRMFDLILLGFTLPGDSSTRILKSLEQYQLSTRVIVIGKTPGLESAVKSATLAARGHFRVR